MGIVDRIECVVVTQKRAAELGRRRIRGRGDSLNDIINQVARTRQTNVGESCRLVCTVLAIVVGNRQFSILGHGRPLPELVGLGLGWIRVHSWLGPRIPASGEGRTAVIRDAYKNLIVASTRNL